MEQELLYQWGLAIGALIYCDMTGEFDPCYTAGQKDIETEKAALFGRVSGLEFRLREMGVEL